MRYNKLNLTGPIPVHLTDHQEEIRRRLRKIERKALAHLMILGSIERNIRKLVKIRRRDMIRVNQKKKQLNNKILILILLIQKSSRTIFITYIRNTNNENVTESQEKKKIRSRSQSKHSEENRIVKGRQQQQPTSKLFGWSNEDFEQANSFLKKQDQRISKQNRKFRQIKSDPVQHNDLNVDLEKKAENQKPQNDRRQQWRGKPNRRYDKEHERHQNNHSEDRPRKEIQLNKRKSDQVPPTWEHDKYLKDSSPPNSSGVKPRGSPIY